MRVSDTRQETFPTDVSFVRITPYIRFDDLPTAVFPPFVSAQPLD